MHCLDYFRIGSEWIVGRTQQRVRVVYAMPYVNPPEIEVVDAELERDEKTFRVGAEELEAAPAKAIVGESLLMKSREPIGGFIQSLPPGSKITIEIGKHDRNAEARIAHFRRELDPRPFPDRMPGSAPTRLGL